MIALGVKAKDKVTGFTGIVTGRVEHLHGMPRVCIETMDKDGKPLDGWFEETRVEIVE